MLVAVLTRAKCLCSKISLHRWHLPHITLCMVYTLPIKWTIFFYLNRSWWRQTVNAIDRLMWICEFWIEWAIGVYVHRVCRYFFFFFVHNDFSHSISMFVQQFQFDSFEDTLHVQMCIQHTPRIPMYSVECRVKSDSYFHVYVFLCRHVFVANLFPEIFLRFFFSLHFSDWKSHAPPSFTLCVLVACLVYIGNAGPINTVTT